MNNPKKIQAALISVFDKDGLAPIVQKLHSQGVAIYSTGGTEKFIKEMGIPVIAVETITGYPSILGGRVKTLHPKIFGGILNRQKNPEDVREMSMFSLPQLDLIIVDLYPFEAAVAENASEVEIIEKIDIGGISLIRAAAKNYEDTVCIASKNEYGELLQLLETQGVETSEEQRKYFARKAFHTSSQYDTAIYNYFNQSESEDSFDTLLKSFDLNKRMPLRYGENPHQKGTFYGNFDAMFDKLHGKELSYNNLLDVDAAVTMMSEFQNEPPTFAILKHNNACGLAQRNTVLEAYEAALAADPVSAFGGILISNSPIDKNAAEAIDQLFCEVVIAPGFEPGALEILKAKKNRILLVLKKYALPEITLRSCLNGTLVQDRDNITDSKEILTYPTNNKPTETELNDLLFASKICKHTKSNTIVLVKNRQLMASGTGQTSRVDALKQAIEKARSFDFNLDGAVMASDAFFPFPDCVEIADKAGIQAVIQPGGSIKDELSIAYCNENEMAMVFTGIRHFKH